MVVQWRGATTAVAPALHISPHLFTSRRTSAGSLGISLTILSRYSSSSPYSSYSSSFSFDAPFAAALGLGLTLEPLPRRSSFAGAALLAASALLSSSSQGLSSSHWATAPPPPPAKGSAELGAASAGASFGTHLQPLGQFLKEYLGRVE